MSRRIYVISDTHFGHSNILKFTDGDGKLIRGSFFKTIEEHDAFIIKQWNDVVRDNDIVYHLGDVYFGKYRGQLDTLKGRKRLILGNHDDGKDQVLQRVFQKISCSRMFPEFGAMLSHIPLHISQQSSTGIAKWWINIHGHIHQQTPPSLSHRNVSVEATAYRPVDITNLV